MELRSERFLDRESALQERLTPASDVTGILRRPEMDESPSTGVTAAFMAGEFRSATRTPLAVRRIEAQ